MQWISVVTTLQEMTPADYQARIVGLLESLGAAMPGVGYLLGAALVALGSPRTAYAVAGTGVLLLVLAALVLRPSLERAPVQRRRSGDVPLSDSARPSANAGNVGTQGPLSGNAPEREPHVT